MVQFWSYISSYIGRNLYLLYTGHSYVRPRSGGLPDDTEQPTNPLRLGTCRRNGSFLLRNGWSGCKVAEIPFYTFVPKVLALGICRYRYESGLLRPQHKVQVRLLDPVRLSG